MKKNTLLLLALAGATYYLLNRFRVAAERSRLARSKRTTPDVGVPMAVKG